MTDNPLISVIIPTFNRKDMLKQCIYSIFAQTYHNLELIIVDNMSTDRSEEYIKNLHDRRIKYFRNPNNGVIAVNRNFGMRQATGEYIAFCDDDDLWLPNKLEKQIAIFRQTPNLTLVSSNAIIFKDNKLVKLISRQTNDICPNIRSLLNANLIFNSTVLLKKDIINTVGYLNESNVICGFEDYDFWLKIAKEFENSIYVLGEPLALYRIHSKNFTEFDLNKDINKFKVILEKHIDIISKDEINNILELKRNALVLWCKIDEIDLKKSSLLSFLFSNIYFATKLKVLFFYIRRIIIKTLGIYSYEIRNKDRIQKFLNKTSHQENENNSIAILCTGLNDFGGVINLIHSWLKNINRSKFNVYFIFYSKNQKCIDYLVNNLDKSITAKFIFLKREKYLFPLFTIFKLGQIIKKNNIKLVHSFFIQSDLIAYCAKKLFNTNIKLVSAQVGKLINCAPLKKQAYLSINKFIRDKFDLNIVISNGLLNELISEKQIRSFNSKVIHSGIETVNENSRNHPLQTENLNISVISRLSQEKGIIYYIKAISEISKLNKFSKLKFNIYGDGTDKAYLEKITFDLNLSATITFHNRVKDIDNILMQTDILVCPSLTEGLPILILEALSYKVCVVATDVGGVKELIINNETGILVKSKNVVELSDAIIKLLENPKLITILGENGRKFVIKHFSIKDKIEELENTYINILNT